VIRLIRSTNKIPRGFPRGPVFADVAVVVMTGDSDASGFWL
jgi:hypothetical protein